MGATEYQPKIIHGITGGLKGRWISDGTQEFTIAAHAGEAAQETGNFHCQSCNAVVHVTKDKKIPECPNGHKTFNSRTGEPSHKGK